MSRLSLYVQNGIAISGAFKSVLPFKSGLTVATIQRDLVGDGDLIGKPVTLNNSKEVISVGERPTAPPDTAPYLINIGVIYHNLQINLGDWIHLERFSIIDDLGVESLNATRRWLVHQSAMAGGLIQNSTDPSFISRVLKQYNFLTPPRVRAWYRLMRAVESKVIRDSWNSGSLAVGATIHSDLFNDDGTSRNIDGTFRQTSQIFSSNVNNNQFDPTWDNTGLLQ